MAGGRFEKGVDLRRGTNGGRPSGEGFRARCLKATRDGDELIEVWVKIMRESEDEKNVLKASELLAQRAFGNPPNTNVNVDAKISILDGRTPEELESIVDNLLGPKLLSDK